MEFYEYVINLLFDGIETFCKTFTIVSGKATLRVLYFSLGYLFLSIICKVTGLFTFLDVWSALLAVVILFIVNSISNIQAKDINKFKDLLKGDIDNEQGQ